MSDTLILVGVSGFILAAVSMVVLRILWGRVVHSPDRKVRSDTVPLAIFLVLMVAMCLSVVVTLIGMVVSFL